VVYAKTEQRPPVRAVEAIIAGSLTAQDGAREGILKAEAKEAVAEA
jgi:hypothetical protein